MVNMSHTAMVTGNLTHCWVFHLCPHTMKTTKLMWTYPDISRFRASPGSGPLTSYFVNTKALAYSNEMEVFLSPGFAGSKMWGGRLSIKLRLYSAF